MDMSTIKEDKDRVDVDRRDREEVYSNDNY